MVYINTIIFVVGILNINFSHGSLSGRVCGVEPGKTFCCSDFYESPNGECIECETGFTTTQGKSPCQKCPYPTYGRRCPKRCNCTATQRCDHVEGCVNNTDLKSSGFVETTTPETDSKDTNQWPIVASIVVAVLALIIALGVVFSKVTTKIMKTEVALKALSKISANKGGCERNTNVYGSYQTKGDNFRDEDDYEFDSDHDEIEEDQYAVIRDSQLISMVTSTVPSSDSLRLQCDNAVPNYISSYNHLNLTGIRPPPGGQTPDMNKYSHATYGNHMLTFKDDVDYV